MAAKKRRKNWSLIVSALVIGGLVIAYFVEPEFREFVQEIWRIMRSGDRRAISEWFRELGYWGPVMIILTMVAQMFLVVIPSWGLMIVSVIAYGPVWGALLAICAVGVASFVGYFIGKAFGRAALEGIIGKSADSRLSRFIDRYGFGAVFLFRLSPLLSSDAISLVSGMLRMNFRRFMAATLLGITPLAVAIAYFGSESERLKTGLYWLGGIGLGLYVLYIFIDYRLRKREKGEGSE